MLPLCPYLPKPAEKMDASVLTALGQDRGPDFYLTALTYGNYLWRDGHAGRAILKLDRAFGADLQGDEPILKEWPLPYFAMGWIFQNATSFVGNPRVHFQHLADRMNEPRRDQRRWRMWGCWALCRISRPDLPDDPKHEVEEPTFEKIETMLNQHGHGGESTLWLLAVEQARKKSHATSL